MVLTLAILFLTALCSSNSHLTELVGFENSTNGDHFYASPSGESLNIIRLIVGADSNVTLDVTWSANLTEHGCRYENTLKLKNRFVIECKQETLGGRKLLEVTNSPTDKWQVHSTTLPGRMNEGASMVAIYNHQWYYIFARGGKLCFKGFDEQDISCSQVCKNILKIASENSSSELFTIACEGPGEYDNFVTKYSRAQANLTDFKMSYPPHVHRVLFVTRNWTAFVGNRSMSILDNNYIDGGFRYCSSPSKDKIVSGFVKGSYLFLTVENRDSQNIEIAYATYQYDLSMRTCVGRKLEGDGCIAYDSHFTDEWLLACPVEIGKYQYKLVNTNPNVTLLPTSSPTTPLSTIFTTGEAMAINSTETLPMDSTIIPSMVSTTSKTPGSANNGTSTSIVPTSSSHSTDTTAHACETPTIDTDSAILPWEYIIIILLILVIIVLIVVLVCAPCWLSKYVRFFNRKLADYSSPSPAEERAKKVPFETVHTRGESPFKSVEEKACTLDKSNQQSPPHSIASLQSSGITPQQSELPQTSGPAHGRGTITVTANLESHCFQPIHAPTSIPQQSGRTETSEPTFGTGLLGVTPNLEARPFQPALSESSASTQQLSRLPENNKTNIGTEALKLMSSPKPHHLQLTNSESPPFDRTTIKNGISAQFDDSQTCILSRTDPTPQVVHGFKPTMPVSQEPSSHSLSTKDPPASSKVDEPDTKDPPASSKVDEPDTKDPPASCKVDEPDAEDPPTSCKVDEPGTKDPLASCKVDEPDAEDPPTSSKERLLDTEELPSPIPEVGPSHQYNGDSDITLYLSSNLRAAYKPDGLSESHQ